MRRSLFVLMTWIFLSPTAALAKESSRSCDQQLLRGVSYTVENRDGRKVKRRLRFAPFELAPRQAAEFQKFRAASERKYGVSGASSYGPYVCQFFFGAYRHVSVPVDVPAVSELLQRCPLKTLEHLLVDVPIRDCAPGVVHCQPPGDSTQHPLDRIPCEREL